MGRARRSIGVVVPIALVAGACGSESAADADSEPATAAAPAEAESDGAEPDDSDGDRGAEGDGILDRAESGELGGGRATVELDGATYEYARVEGAVTVCTELMGTFQVLLPQIDPSAGAAIDGPELNLLVLQEGADLGDATPDLYIEVGTVDAGTWYAGESFFAEMHDGEPEPIDARADGLSFSATVPLTLSFDANTTADAVIDVRCD